MKATACLFLSLCLSIGYATAQQDSSQDSLRSRVKPGQEMPSFTVKETNGKKIKMDDLRGNVVLVNFWATWCSPCRAEMPRLEREIWQKYKDRNFTIVGIAREQTLQEVTAFLTQSHFTYPMAIDPDRKIFSLFAEAGIPRNYVVSRDGKILYQSLGYGPKEFDEMKKVIEQALKNDTRTK